jgi:hypothetical protein
VEPIICFLFKILPPANWPRWAIFDKGRQPISRIALHHWLLPVGENVSVGSKAALTTPKCYFCCYPSNGHRATIPACRFRAKGGHAPSRNSDNGRSSCVVVTLCCGARFFLNGNSAHYFEDTLTLHPFRRETRRLTDMPEEILSLP